MSEVDGRATGGCAIFVKKGIPHEVLELDTGLQAVVVFIYLGFYVAFNTVQVISRRVVGRAEETST